VGSTPAVGFIADGWANHGEARQVPARHRETRHGKTRQDKARGFGPIDELQQMPMTYDKAITVRLDSALLKKLDTYRARVSRETGLDLTRADAARKLIADGVKR
jgi:hypothetical protein